MKFQLKHILYLLIPCINMVPSYSQVRGFEEVSIAAEIESKKIIETQKTEQVLIFSSGCIGCEILAGCQCNFGQIETYLIWKENDKTFIQFIDCCTITKSKQVDLNFVLDYLNENLKEIFNSTLKSDYINVHYLFDRISLVSKDTIKTKESFNYQLESDNKYSHQNKNQEVIKFQNILKSKINQLKKEHNFN